MYNRKQDLVLYRIVTKAKFSNNSFSTDFFFIIIIITIIIVRKFINLFTALTKKNTIKHYRVHSQYGHYFQFSCFFRFAGKNYSATSKQKFFLSILYFFYGVIKGIERFIQNIIWFVLFIKMKCCVCGCITCEIWRRT